MSDVHEKLTQIINSIVESGLEVLRASPYFLNIQALDLSLRSNAATELPVALYQRFEGEPRVWLTLSLDLPTALIIADKALKNAGKYAMGFSEIEQRILKECFDGIGREFISRQNRNGESSYVPSTPQMSFGKKISTAARDWPPPFLTKMQISGGSIQLDVGIEASEGFRWDVVD